MYEFDFEESSEFLARNMDNINNCFSINHYEYLIACNRELITNIRSVLTGYIVPILSNTNYYYILSKLHKVSVTITDICRIELDKFIILFGVNSNEYSDEEEYKLVSAMHSFDIKVIDGIEDVFFGSVQIKYNDNSEVCICDISSEIIDDLFVDRYKMSEFVKNKISMIEEARKKNDKLSIIINRLYNLLPGDDIEELINRNVYLVTDESEESDDDE